LFGVETTLDAAALEAALPALACGKPNWNDGAEPAEALELEPELLPALAEPLFPPEEAPALPDDPEPNEAAACGILASVGKPV